MEYLCFLIISSFLKVIQKYFKKKDFNEDKKIEKLIFNEIDIEMEYGFEKKRDYFLYINLFFVVVIELLTEVLDTFQCSILDYWMLEIIFFEIFNSKFLKTKIYKHHLFSLIFIIFSCSLIKTISITVNFSLDTEETKIFDNRKWLISLGVIGNLFLNIFASYLFCNEKYYLEK